MSSSEVPAQKQLVDRCISWPLVEARLAEFPALARAFPLGVLKRHRDDPPYFCHYMAWRLGTWKGDALVQRLDDLLHHGESLPNWRSERERLQGGREFAEFWSLVWQLQVARYLSQMGRNTRWLGKGPDLAVEIDGETLYVECYALRKSFGVAEFVDELLPHVGTDLRAEYSPFLRLSLTCQSELTLRLSQFLTPVISADHLEHCRRAAVVSYPVLVSSWPSQNFSIYLDGRDIEAYHAQQSAAGDPDLYLESAFTESIRAKADSNHLDAFRPNLLAISYVLGDAQKAIYRADELNRPLPRVALGANIDAMAFSMVGIDEELTKSRFRLVEKSGRASPATKITHSHV